MKKSFFSLLTILSLVLFSSAYASFDFNVENPITVVSREDGSGTRGAFIELLGIEEKQEDGTKLDRTTLEAITINSTAVMLTTVANDPYAIGYISLGSLNDTVKALEVNDISAQLQTILDGTYQISRPFMIATQEIENPLRDDFISFIISSQGQAIVEENGYIPLEVSKTYDSQDSEGKITVAGSSSVTPVMEKLKEAYVLLNPKSEVEIQQSDSSSGLSLAASGVCDIAMASRDLKESELESGLLPQV
ncbi:MAG: phosphate ABC transporter substrate-binding protein, partial [Clostridiales bacterium]|nr:phosphate ABC transporter substrate-binding protein [Clostridiales bacterium]